MWLTREHSMLREQHMQRPWGRNKCGVSEEQKGARLVFGEQRGGLREEAGARFPRPLDCGEELGLFSLLPEAFKWSNLS